MKVTFEMTDADAKRIADHLASGAWKPGHCWLSVHLDAVHSPSTQLWEGAFGRLRVEGTAATVTASAPAEGKS